MRRLPLLLLALALLACVDKDNSALERARPALDRLLPLVERDVAQVQKGMPAGAQLLAKHIDDDPAADPAGLQRSIGKARAGVHDLVVAKSTFFVFAGKDGVMLRSEADPDIAAGESLVQAIPDAKKLFDPKAGVVELWGFSKGLRGVNEGGDLQWIVGHPVVSAAGELKGAFVSGWSLRKYAEYLENDARLSINKQAEEAGESPPLIYAFVVKANTAYGGAQTPDVNAKAVTELALSDKQSYEGQLDVEGKHFVVAAKPAPPLGKDAVVALLWSPL